MLNIFKNKDKNKEGDEESNLIKIAALLIHAAKVDENYSEKEKLIIINFLKSVDLKIDFKKIMQKAEKDEENSNQILEYTQEVKKMDVNTKKLVLEFLWRIILSDNKSDMYESTLMRRICGLLYLPDKLSGEVKLKILKEKNK